MCGCQPDRLAWWHAHRAYLQDGDHHDGRSQVVKDSAHAKGQQRYQPSQGGPLVSPVGCGKQHMWHAAGGHMQAAYSSAHTSALTACQGLRQPICQHLCPVRLCRGCAKFQQSCLALLGSTCSPLPAAAGQPCEMQQATYVAGERMQLPAHGQDLQRQVQSMEESTTQISLPIRQRSPGRVSDSSTMVLTCTPSLATVPRSHALYPLPA
jgi:hypothetical protein